MEKEVIKKEINELREEVLNLLEEAREEYNVGKKFQHETSMKFNHAFALASEAKTLIVARLWVSDN